MAGTSLNHARIVSNWVGELRQKVANDCEVVSSDLRLEVKASGPYTYPDVIVICGEPRLRDDGALDTLLNPRIIIEVLSRSTENCDKGGKFDLYKVIADLAEYITVAQDRIQIQTRVRQTGQQWLFTEYTEKSGQKLKIESIGVELDIARLYERVSFPEK